MTAIAEMILGIHEHLDAAAVPHAFGGALALAWCTFAPRGTSDIDLNVFLPEARAQRVVDALPGDVAWSEREVELLVRDGQVRLWWETTPIDVFLNTTDFHLAAAARATHHDFAGVSVPFLSCADLAVFKAFFNRLRDWADLEAMLAAETIDVAWVIGTLVEHLGTDDERVATLLRLTA
jgi:hypothetical protein